LRGAAAAIGGQFNSSAGAAGHLTALKTKLGEKGRFNVTFHSLAGHSDVALNPTAPDFTAILNSVSSGSKTPTYVIVRPYSSLGNLWPTAWINQENIKSKYSILVARQALWELHQVLQGRDDWVFDMDLKGQTKYSLDERILK
jgi:hypothetical protein